MSNSVTTTVPNPAPQRLHSQGPACLSSFQARSRDALPNGSRVRLCVSRKSVSLEPETSGHQPPAPGRARRPRPRRRLEPQLVRSEATATGRLGRSLSPAGRGDHRSPDLKMRAPGVQAWLTPLSPCPGPAPRPQRRSPSGCCGSPRTTDALLGRHRPRGAEVPGGASGTGRACAPQPAPDDAPRRRLPLRTARALGASLAPLGDLRQRARAGLVRVRAPGAGVRAAPPPPAPAGPRAEPPACGLSGRSGLGGGAPHPRAAPRPPESRGRAGRRAPRWGRRPGGSSLSSSAPSGPGRAGRPAERELGVSLHLGSLWASR